MDGEEKALLWKIAILSFVVGIAGAVIGGLFTFYGSYWAWDQQQNALNEQQILERHNIAQAIYIDISKIESNFNYSLSHMALYENNTNQLEDPGSFKATTIQYYDDNGLYYVFRHDISGFNSTVSKDIFDFYNLVEDIERKRGMILAIFEKHMRGENITQFDVIMAHRYSKGIFETKMPYCINLAERIKKELIQNYNVEDISPQYIVIDSDPQTFYLMDGQAQVHTF